MSKLRIVYIASLVILGALLIFTVLKPIGFGGEFSELTRGSVIKDENHWIIQFNIINREDKETEYIINWSTGGEVYNHKRVTIKSGRTFTNIHHVYPETVTENAVRLSIWKEGETTPFEDITYHLK